jgi:TP901 family phage tail tape measure protein
VDRKLALTILFQGNDKLSGALKSIVGLGEKGTTALARLRREARSLDGQLSGVRKEIAGASGNISALINRERELEAAVAQVNRQVERQKKLLAIDNRVSQMQAQASAYKAAGRENMMAGATLLAPFVLAGREAMNFSSGMVDIQQKAELTNRETQQMAASILAAARAAHQLPEAMRSSVDVLAGFGMDPRQAAKLAEPIGRVGTAFKVELADGASAAYANINNLKVALGDIPAAFDIMAAGANAGAFELKDMARWFPQLTTQAQALGQSGTAAVADLTAALQIARRGAGTADQAATNVTNLLQKINSPETIRKFQKNFGVDLPAALQEAYRKGKTPLEAIAEITQRAIGGNMARLGFAFEDAQAQGAIRSLILDLDDYRKMRAQIGNSRGTVDRAFAQREMRDASIAWASFKGQLSETAIVLGTTLLPAATGFLGMVNNVMRAVGSWAQANPRLAATLFNLVAGLAVARIGVGALQFAFGSLLGPMATAWGLYKKWRVAGSIAETFPKAAKGMGMLRTAATAMLPSVSKIGGLLVRGLVSAFALLSNPVGWGVLAAAAVGLVWYFWDDIKAAITSVDWPGLGKSIISGIFYGLGFAWTAITTWVPAAFNGLINIVRSIDWIAAGAWVIGAAKEGIIAGWSALTTWWHSAWPSLIDFVKGLTWKSVGLYIADQLTFGLASKINKNGLGATIASVAASAQSGLAAGSNAAKVAHGAPAIAGKRAGGGPVTGGRRYLVGERGPELFEPSTSGRIIPNHSLAVAGTAARAGGGVTINVYQKPGEDSEALARRLAALIDRQRQNAARGAYRDE